MTDSIHEKFDIWEMWDAPAALLIKNKAQIMNGEVRVYSLDEKNELSPYSVLSLASSFPGSEREGISFQKDLLIQMLYFAAFRAKTNVRLSGFYEDDIVLDVNDLNELLPYIDWLATILPYRAKRIDAARFAEDMKDGIIYYSTLAGENKEGENQFYSLSSRDTKDLLYPVFLTMEHARAFFDSKDRNGYTIMSTTLQKFLRVMKSDTITSEMGLVIEPMSNFNVVIQGQ